MTLDTVDVKTTFYILIISHLLCITIGLLLMYLIGTSSEKSRFDYIENMAKRLIEYGIITFKEHVKKQEDAMEAALEELGRKNMNVNMMGQPLSASQFRETQETYASAHDKLTFPERMKEAKAAKRRAR